jgi:hypothetical protein
VIPALAQQTRRRTQRGEATVGGRIWVSKKEGNPDLERAVAPTGLLYLTTVSSIYPFRAFGSPMPQKKLKNSEGNRKKNLMRTDEVYQGGGVLRTPSTEG